MAKKLPRRPGGPGPLPPPKKSEKGPRGPGSKPAPEQKKPPPARAPVKTRATAKKRPRGPRLPVGKWLKRFALGSLTVLLVAGLFAGYVYYRARASLPLFDGQLRVPGLTSSVDVVRDARGIPRLEGSDVRDLARAMGFVHAQDRYFQMELSRRLGAGRLAELFGEPALEQDRRALRLGLARAAQAELDRAAPLAREILEAYAAGVNAYRDRALSHLPPELQILGHVPAPWRPIDCLVIGKWFAQVLSVNAELELLRARLVESVGIEAARALTGLSRESTSSDADPAPEVALGLASGTTPGAFRGASNAWAVGGSRTASGRPLLAADPHLPLTLPSVFYPIHLFGDGLDVAGASVPGVPLVLFGQNPRVAWGVTALFADVQDIYVETTNPADRSQYEWEGEWAALDEVREVIPVKDAEDAIEIVRLSRHGVVVGETEGGDLLVKRWDALWRGDHVSALLALNRAGSWEEFIEALRTWAAPALAFVYADVEGNIGFFPAGDIPVRTSHEGTLPVDGASGAFEWEGSIPHELKPSRFNPESGVIVSANHQMLSPDTPYPLGLDTLADHRARRIEELLESSPSLGVQDFIRIQTDRYDPSTEPVLRVAVGIETSEPRELEALGLLRSWNGRMDVGAAPAIYQALYAALFENAFRDELGDGLFEAFAAHVELGGQGGVHALIDEPDSSLWDDRATPAVENREAIFRRSLTEALATLDERVGGDPSRWSWGDLHGVRFSHPLGADARLGPLLSRGPVSFGGSSHTIANAAVSLTEPFETLVGTSFRLVVDLADPGSSLAVIPTGASGHPLSAHYFDQNEAWMSGRLFPLRSSEAEARLTLSP